VVFPEEANPLDPPARETGQPRIKELLARALEWQAWLQAQPGLTQTVLAKETGISRVRVTQIMNLLRLTPDIQKEILELQSSGRRNRITETGLRPLIARPIQEQMDACRRFWGGAKRFEGLPEGVWPSPSSCLAILVNDSNKD
jgi:ParB-like chromosome segregation protein Spo0J